LLHAGEAGFLNQVDRELAAGTAREVLLFLLHAGEAGFLNQADHELAAGTARKVLLFLLSKQTQHLLDK